MDSEMSEPKQPSNVSVPVTLFHQMAACFYGDGPTWADLTGSGAGSDLVGTDPGEDDQIEEEEIAPVVMPKFKVKSHGIREGMSHGDS